MWEARGQFYWSISDVVGVNAEATAESAKLAAARHIVTRAIEELERLGLTVTA